MPENGAPERVWLIFTNEDLTEADAFAEWTPDLADGRPEYCYRRVPELGSPEWEAMVERARLTYNRTSGSIQKAWGAALRAALGLDQPHR